MARITDEDKARNEAAVRAAMERLLRGELPPGGRTDLKTLAHEAGVPRTGFYPRRNRDGSERPGPYQHLAEEFERRMAVLRNAGAIADPREAQIARLKTDNAVLRQRLANQDERITELTEFQTLAISRLAAQHQEIQRLRDHLATTDKVARLPSRATTGR